MSKKKTEQRIQAAYNRVGNGVQVGIMDLGKIHDAGKRALDSGADDDAIAAAMADVIAKVRLN